MKDFFDQELSVGDMVAFEQPKYVEEYVHRAARCGDSETEKR